MKKIVFTVLVATMTGMTSAFAAPKSFNKSACVTEAKAKIIDLEYFMAQTTLTTEDVLDRSTSPAKFYNAGTVNGAEASTRATIEQQIEIYCSSVEKALNKN